MDYLFQPVIESIHHKKDKDLFKFSNGEELWVKENSLELFSKDWFLAPKREEISCEDCVKNIKAQSNDPLIIRKTIKTMGKHFLSEDDIKVESFHGVKLINMSKPSRVIEHSQVRTEEYCDNGIPRGLLIKNLASGEYFEVTTNLRLLNKMKVCDPNPERFFNRNIERRELL